MAEIFVIEDDDSIREMLEYALQGAGFEVFGFSDGDNALQILSQKMPELILLDIMLPGSDGLSILKKLKRSEHYQSIPIIMLTAKGSELDRIKGLDLGADDYITKPFSIMEVVARVKAVLRRCTKKAVVAEEYVVGQIVLHRKKRTVSNGQEEVLLTFKEFELLQYMMLNQGIVLNREQLLEAVWGYDYQGESRTVDMHIKTLRQKLQDTGDVIKTIRGVGYKIGG